MALSTLANDPKNPSLCSVQIKEKATGQIIGMIILRVRYTPRSLMLFDMDVI